MERSARSCVPSREVESIACPRALSPAEPSPADHLFPFRPIQPPAIERNRAEWSGMERGTVAKQRRERIGNLRGGKSRPCYHVWRPAPIKFLAGRSRASVRAYVAIPHGCSDHGNLLSYYGPEINRERFSLASAPRQPPRALLSVPLLENQTTPPREQHRALRPHPKPPQSMENPNRSNRNPSQSFPTLSKANRKVTTAETAFDPRQSKRESF